MRFLCVLGIALCAAATAARAGAPVLDAERAHETRPIVSGVEVQPLEVFDFQHRGPLEFLTYLRSARSPFSVTELHTGWLRSSDLRPLLDLVSSNEPCALVVMSSASTVPRERSTVGQEALFLLAGIRDGTYPPALHSHAYDANGRQALLEWARRHAR